MNAKIVILVACVAMVAARPQDSHGHGHGQEHGHGHALSSQHVLLHNGHHELRPVEHDHAKYEFAYKVVDPHTHDLKSQHEHRDGDAVKGEYSLHQPDGTVRVVEYYADKKNGFHANVKIEGHSKHIIPEHHHHH